MEESQDEEIAEMKRALDLSLLIFMIALFLAIAGAAIWVSRLIHLI
ncbi:MAG TPA: hypothetical protein VNU44_14580 [Bryobacteraceae bacterium]|jgi:hypothetical protein|nr:hypothetical protein [Bryobacteraceae bacterium]